ncbi:MAG: NAD-dependent epimerase/dehydratase family protein [Burkholderiales bacterium]|nr:NAD-dependent epimerase/dehydratase family protein [Burkholderiales bacterium]MBZ0248211.1 NAD-dependent epimerase/dehydratase family protein [Burkholderiales bacterium]
MRCLVLGGTGFIGGRLTAALRAAGSAVRVLSRSPAGPAAVPGAHYLAADFLDAGAVRAAVEGIEVVFHLVGTSLPAGSNADPQADVRGNLLGTLGLLEACRDAGVRRVVFVSSGGTVYGEPRTLPVAETHPTDPLCSYGITKLAIEKYLRLFHRLHGQDYRVLRLANPYGPGQRTDRRQGVVTTFLQRAMHGEPLEIWGDGAVVRDFVYIADAVDALQLAAVHEGPDRVFNIGSGSGLSLRDVVAATGELLGRPLEVAYRPGRAWDVPANVLDIALAREKLGWEPRTGFTQGLVATKQWLEGRP